MNNFELSARERFGEPNKRLSTAKEMRFVTQIGKAILAAERQ